MTLRLVVVLMLMLSVGGLGLAATIIHYRIVDAVNARLPPEEQFELFGWYATKTRKLHSEYRRLYPGGKLLLRESVLVAIAMSCMVAAAATMGFNFLMIAWLAGASAFLLWLTYFRKLSKY